MLNMRVPWVHQMLVECMQSGDGEAVEMGKWTSSVRAAAGDVVHCSVVFSQPAAFRFSC